MGNEAPITKNIHESSAEQGVRAIHERVRHILEEEALNPQDFVELYGESNVARDLQTG